MNKKILLGIALLTTGVMATTVVAQSIKPSQALLATRTVSNDYTCASIHFGMDDQTLSGTIEWGNSGFINTGEHEDEIGTLDGITLQSYSVSGNSFQLINNHGLKGHKNNSTLTLNFDTNVRGCDVYAVAWNGDAAFIEVDGVRSEQVTNNSDIAGQSGSISAVYTKYSFNFNPTKTLTIAFTKRVFVGDIALRVGGESVEPETPVDPVTPTTDTQEKMIFANLNLENGVQYSEPFQGDGFTVTFAGGGNDGKYYTTGQGIRVYGNGTMTIASDTHINKITITFDGSNKPSSSDVVNVGTYVVDTGVWTGDATEVVFTRPTGSGHWRVQTIEVTLSD